MANPNHLSRRDFLKLSGVSSLAWWLASCVPARKIADNLQTIEMTYGTPKIQSERIIGGKGGDYRIQTITADSLKPTLSGSPNTQADNQLEQQSRQINDALNKVDHIVKIQRKKDGQWQDMMLPGSMMSKVALDEFNNYLENHAKVTLNDKTRAEYISIVFDPNLSPEQKLASISSYVNLPADASNIQGELKAISDFGGDIPDNAPWDFIFDNYSGAAALNSNAPLYETAKNTGTSFGIFVPKDSEINNVKNELGKMFLPIGDVVKPRVFMITYMVETPPQKQGDQPTYSEVKKISVFYGENDDRNKIYDPIGKVKDQELSIMSDSDMPVAATAGINIEGGQVVSTKEVGSGNIDFAFIPRGMSSNKGEIKPVVFFDDKKDIYQSKVYVIEDNNLIDRVDQGKKNWVSKVTQAVTSLQGLGVTDGFKFGLLPPKIAFGRIFKGGKVNQTTQQVDLPSLALFPNDQGLVDSLATLYLQGNSLNQWGTVIYSGENDNYPRLELQSFNGTDNLFGIAEGISWAGPAGKIEAGAIYNILDILKLKNDNVVPFYDRQSGSFVSENVAGIGNRLEDIVDNVMVMGTKNELTEALGTFGKIAPWALTIIAALIQPETIFTNLWKVITWIAAKLPFLAL